MRTTPSDFAHFNAPDDDLIGKTPLAFLKNLGQPAWITLEGKDTSRSRAIVTLLHGNEPSGLTAVHQYLKSRQKPATNLGIFVVSVDSALHPPYFSHRYLPKEMDFNRCFGTDVSNNQTILADKILRTLTAFSPEAIIDTHNTSAHSEPFCVASSTDTSLRQVAQIFTHRLVELDLRLGTLIEQPLGCPVVTIEFGGFLDKKSDQLASASIESFISRNDLFLEKPNKAQILRHPLRLEVAADCQLHYAASIQTEAHITLFNTIDQLNFAHLSAGTKFGWIDKQSLNQLQVRLPDGENIALNLFEEKDNFLLTRCPMTIFMATTDVQIAVHDCLLYLCLDQH